MGFSPRASHCKNGRFAASSGLIAQFLGEFGRCLNVKQNNSTQTGTDAVDGFAKIVAFVGFLNVIDVQSALFDANVVVVLQVFVFARLIAYADNVIRTCNPGTGQKDALNMDLPTAFFHVTCGFGKPSDLHSILASEPCAKALSVGSRIHLGGTVFGRGGEKASVIRLFLYAQSDILKTT